MQGNGLLKKEENKKRDINKSKDIFQKTWSKIAKATSRLQMGLLSDQVTVYQLTRRKSVNRNQNNKSSFRENSGNDKKKKRKRKRKKPRQQTKTPKKTLKRPKDKAT